MIFARWNTSTLDNELEKKYFYQNPLKEQLIASLGYQKDTLFLDGDRFSHIILRKLYERITKQEEKGESSLN